MDHNDGKGNRGRAVGREAVDILFHAALIALNDSVTPCREDATGGDKDIIDGAQAPQILLRSDRAEGAVLYSNYDIIINGDSGEMIAISIPDRELIDTAALYASDFLSIPPGQIKKNADHIFSRIPMPDEDAAGYAAAVALVTASRSVDADQSPGTAEPTETTDATEASFTRDSHTNRVDVFLSRAEKELLTLLLYNVYRFGDGADRFVPDNATRRRALDAVAGKTVSYAVSGTVGQTGIVKRIILAAAGTFLKAFSLTAAQPETGTGPGPAPEPNRS